MENTPAFLVKQFLQGKEKSHVQTPSFPVQVMRKMWIHVHLYQEATPSRHAKHTHTPKKVPQRRRKVNTVALQNHAEATTHEKQKCTVMEHYLQNGH